MAGSRCRVRSLGNRKQDAGHLLFNIILEHYGPEAVRRWRWMAVAFEGEWAGGFVFHERNIHDHGAAIPQPLDDLVIAETRSLEIVAYRDIRDKSRDAVFLLRLVHRGEQDPDIE